MSKALTIEEGVHLRVSKWTLLFFLLALLTGTFLRISLLVIYPFIGILIYAQLKLRLSRSVIDLLVLIGISFLLSFWDGWYLRYKFLSLYYMIPLVLLLFANPGKTEYYGQDLVRLFFRCLSVIAIINNVIGYFQVFRHPNSDDSFTGIYSTYSISLGGLVILNMVLFIYYYYLYLATKSRKKLWVSLFYLLSFVMGFFGGGLVAFIIAFILTFFKPRFAAIIKIFFIALLSLLAIYFALAILKPNVLNYNISNIKKVLQLDLKNGPRKVIVFYNYGIAYPLNPKDLLFGSGPGTFNSRSAFMIGSPSYFTSISFIKSQNQPYYFKNYAYTLWNDTNTSQALYQDGFRNQPFSSILAFLGEYGLLFTIVFLWYYYRYYRRIANLHAGNHSPLVQAYKRLLKFLFVFLLLLLLMDNFYEYPEIVLLIVTAIKLLHIELIKPAEPHKQLQDNSVANQ